MCQDDKKFKHTHLSVSGSSAVSDHPVGQRQMRIWSLVFVGGHEVSTTTACIVLLHPCHAWVQKSCPGCLWSHLSSCSTHSFSSCSVASSLGSLSKRTCFPRSKLKPSPLSYFSLLSLCSSPSLLSRHFPPCSEDCPSSFVFLSKTVSLHLHILFY